MAIETYIEKNDQAASPLSNLSRRQFLKRMGILGGGIVVYFTIGDPNRLVKAQRFMGPIPKDFNAFLKIGADGKVTGFTGKIEMGQGPITSLPQMLAEERGYHHGRYGSVPLGHGHLRFHDHANFRTPDAKCRSRSQRGAKRAGIPAPEMPHRSASDEKRRGIR